MDIALLDLQNPCAPPIPVRRARLLVGRADECDVKIDDRTVSRRHAQLMVGGRAVCVRDLDSVNGTTVNGVPAGRLEVHDGDLLTFGDAVFRVQVDLSTEDWPAVGAPSEWDFLPESQRH